MLAVVADPHRNATTVALERFGPGTGELVVATPDGYDDVGDEAVEVLVGDRGVRGVESLVELVDRQPALAGGVPQDVSDLLTFGIGRAQRRDGPVRGRTVVGGGHAPSVPLGLPAPATRPRPATTRGPKGILPAP